MEAPPTTAEVAASLRRAEQAAAEAFFKAAAAAVAAVAATPVDAKAALDLAADAGVAYKAVSEAATKATDRAVPPPPPPPAVSLTDRPAPVLLNERRVARGAVPLPPLGRSRANPRFADTRRWSTMSYREAHVPPEPEVEQMRFESNEWCSFIAIFPNRCNISEDGGISPHKLLNLSGRKLAFMIRSSPNAKYSVDTVGGFVDVLEKKEFIITRKAGKSSQFDEMLIFFCDATGPDALEHFKSDPVGEVVGHMAIKLSPDE